MSKLIRVFLFNSVFITCSVCKSGRSYIFTQRFHEFWDLGLEISNNFSDDQLWIRIYRRRNWRCFSVDSAPYTNLKPVISARKLKNDQTWPFHFWSTLKFYLFADSSLNEAKKRWLFQVQGDFFQPSSSN